MILVGCTGESSSEWQRLNAVEFEEAIEEIDNAYLLDTRTQAEWENDGHIENATLIPHDEIDLRASELPEDKDTTILLYCRSGNRSQTAAQTLLDLGYTDVRDLETGIVGWKNAGFPVQYGP
jgi:phage shock protein E